MHSYAVVACEVLDPRDNFVPGFSIVKFVRSVKKSFLNSK